jgi:hypothetical protein
LEAIQADSADSAEQAEEEHPSSPDDVPLSQVGSLFLISFFVFSSVIFDTNVSEPPLHIFPGHLLLLQHFLGTDGAHTTGTESSSVIDAVLAIGIWLEHSNRFVDGPLEDEDFFQYLQTLSLLSANTPSPTLRYAAHILLTSVLHAHPVDSTRLGFIVDTLENCPFETLKASAVGWLKDEVVTAHQRKDVSAFSTPVALSATQPYLFLDLSPLVSTSNEEALKEVRETFPYHMAVLNFLYFISAEQYSEIVPEGTKKVAMDIYLKPLKAVLDRLQTALQPDSGVLATVRDETEASVALSEVQLLGERLGLCMA